MNTHYIDEFLRLKCVSDLIERRFFRGCKEISESMAALAAIRKVLDPRLFRDPSVKLVDLGCGSYPSTAGLAAFVTRWNCVALDPMLPNKYWNIARFGTGRGELKEYIFDSGGLIVIVSVDPRLSVSDILSQVESPELVLVTLTQPGSTYLNNAPEPLHTYEDEGVLSVFSQVSVWRWQGEKIWREQQLGLETTISMV
jgi:hypothetical protein